MHYMVRGQSSRMDEAKDCISGKITWCSLGISSVFSGRGTVPPPWRSLIREIRDRFKVKTFILPLKKIYPLSIFVCGCMAPPDLKILDRPLLGMDGRHPIAIRKASLVVRCSVHQK